MRSSSLLVVMPISMWSQQMLLALCFVGLLAFIAISCAWLATPMKGENF
ncbi:hypothetical protein [Dictyobacter aurantiacus]|nr:hypothetical protein [Dictyobacter aurantiacus]